MMGHVVAYKEWVDGFAVPCQRSKVLSHQKPVGPQKYLSRT